MRTVRVLVSARDPGSATQMRALCPALRADARLDVQVAASGPAFDLLAAAGERPLRFAPASGAAHVPPGGDLAPLLAAADELIRDTDPDVLLVGVSSLGVGLDEALLARAAGRPTFALQDYPGDANAVARAYAGTYFVRDDTAARLTRERFDVATVAVGSLRHAAYAGLDVAALRARTRERIGAPPGGPVLGFFGQPAEIPGHEAAFSHLADALARRPVKPLVLLREHPKFPDHRDRHVTLLRAAGVAMHDASDGDVEPWLAGCDVVATGFSHCSMDYAFLDAWSREPLGSVLFLLTTDEIRRFMREYTGMTQPDGMAAGLGLLAERPEDVEPLLSRALTPAERGRFHEASRQLPRQARLDLITTALVEAGAERMARAGGGR
ncbi:MAG TPA: hypothetical protein VL086_12075 [Candidatus Nitrosotalea sp.]|nr:hypothetical protein [Candidatus Nitrosotalea sp.]